MKLEQILPMMRNGAIFTHPDFVSTRGITFDCDRFVYAEKGVICGPVATIGANMAASDQWRIWEKNQELHDWSWATAMLKKGVSVYRIGSGRQMNAGTYRRMMESTRSVTDSELAELTVYVTDIDARDWTELTK